MRSIWKGTISFGLVNIPIAVGVATQRSDPKFRTLERETLQPVRQQLVGPSGEPVARDDTVKGYEISKDQFLAMTEEELESVSVERRRTLDIIAFVDQSEIDPVYYDRTYLIEPQDHAEKPYALLLEALRDTGKAALGKMVMSGREHLALLRPSGEALVIELLFYPEDVRSKAEIEERVRGTEVRDAELEMAKQLVDSLARPFDPNEFENEHKREILALVERKMAGEDAIVVRDEPAPAPVPDLMSALKASLEQAKGQARRGGDAATNGASTNGSANGDGASADGAAADGAGDGSAPKRSRKRAKATDDAPAEAEAAKPKRRSRAKTS